MTKASSRTSAACVTIIGLTALAASAAQAQDAIIGLEASTSGGYQNNPFQRQGKTASAVLEGVLTPTVDVRWPRDTLRLRGSVTVREYARRYSTEDRYSLGANYQHLLSPLDSVSLGLSARDELINSDNLFLVPTDPSDPLPDPTGPVVPEDGTDLNLLGVRVRRYAANAQGNFTLSSRMKLTVSAGVNASRYGSGRADRSYDNYSGSVGLWRTVNEHTSIGAGGSVSRAEYRDGRPNSDVYSIYAQGSTQFSAAWSVSGQLGASFVNQSFAIPAAGIDSSSVGLTGSIDLCRTTPLDTACFNASREYRPTGDVGTVPQTSFLASYTRRTSDHGRVNGSASYVLSKRRSILTGGTKYLRLRAGYDHDLTERLSFNLAATFNKVSGRDTFGRPSDYGGRVGLTYVFGDRR